MIRAIIFDFDGVILDSVDIKTKAFARLFEEHGPEVVEQVVADHLAQCGISRFRKFAHIYENILHRPMPDGESERLGEKFSALVFDEVVKAAWIPGAVEFLREHHTRYQCFVASGTPATKEEITRRIFAEQGLESSEALFVGDALTDFNAAKACDVRFVGITSGSSDPFPPGTKVLPDLRGLAGLLS